MAGYAINFLYKRAKELGYSVELIDSLKKVYKISKDGKNRYVFKRSLPLNTVTSTKITKSKVLTSKILKEAGFRVPTGFLVSSFIETCELLDSKKITFPLVLKPNDKSLGIGVYTNIQTRDELHALSNLIFQKHKSALLEEYFPWEDYRLLVLDGEVIASARRVPPYVVGDGEHTIRALIRLLNDRKVGKRVMIGKELRRQLEKAHKTLQTVLSKGEKFVLRGNANIQTGGLVEDVTDEMPEFYKDLAVRVASELGLRYTGVDIMSPDLAGNNYVIIEVNGLPSFDIHLIPTMGKIQDPSDHIWKAVFR